MAECEICGTTAWRDHCPACGHAQEAGRDAGTWRELWQWSREDPARRARAVSLLAVMAACLTVPLWVVVQFGVVPLVRWWMQ